MARILVAAGAGEPRDGLVATLAGAGHEVVAAAAVAEHLAGGGWFDLLLADVRLLPDGPPCRVPVLVLTTWPGMAAAVDAVRQGACDLLREPYDGSEVLLRVGRVLEERPGRGGAPGMRIADAAAGPTSALVGQPLAAIEKQVILSTLEQFRGHRTKTAGALGIGVRTLGIKLKRWRDEGERVEEPARATG